MSYSILYAGHAVTIVNTSTWMDIIDSELLPLTDIQIVGLKIDGQMYYINDTFLHRTALVSYLNTTFTEDNDLEGVEFRSDETYLQWRDSSDNIQTIEVVAILKTILTIFKVGNPPEVVNKETVDVANGDEIVHVSLADEVQSVHVGNIMSEPIDATGWSHNAEATKLSFPAQLQDIHVYVQTTQATA